MFWVDFIVFKYFGFQESYFQDFFSLFVKWQIVYVECSLFVGDLLYGFFYILLKFRRVDIQ